MHPDKCPHPQAHQAFIKLNKAFKELQDPEKVSFSCNYGFLWTKRYYFDHFICCFFQNLYLSAWVKIEVNISKCFDTHRLIGSLFLRSCLIFVFSFVCILQRKALDEKIKLKEEQEKFKVYTVVYMLVWLLFETVIILFFWQEVWGSYLMADTLTACFLLL